MQATQGLKQSFEKELKFKLAQKANNKSMEQLLLQSFKYFDMDNSGSLSPAEFSKAVEKIGIMIPTKQDLQTLFNIYDVDQNGTIDYREFAS